MKFSTLLNEIQKDYPEQTRKFHVLAARYCLGAEGDDETFRARVTSSIPIARMFYLRPYITKEQAAEIINRREELYKL